MTISPSPERYYYEDEIELREIIEIIRKHFRLVLILPIVAAIIAFGASKYLIVPEYEASAQVGLGTFSVGLYSDPTSAKQILGSRDLLRQVLDDLGISYGDDAWEALVKAVTVEEVTGTRMLVVNFRHHEASVARAVVEAMAGHFIQKSDVLYAQEYELLTKRHKELVEEYNAILATHQIVDELLVSLENGMPTEPESAFVWTRASEQWSRDRTALLALGDEIHSLEIKQLTMGKAVLIDTAAVSHNPVNVRPLLNVAIAVVLGGMIALGIVFVWEYLEKNPLRPAQ